MRVVAIVQARMGSVRLPNKVLSPIAGKPMIELLLARLARASEIDEIVLATSKDRSNLPLIDLVSALGYRHYAGSENDVLDRYLQAAKMANAEVVVRITADCPLIDPKLVDEAVSRFKLGDVDYLSNAMPPSYPDGLDTEVFTFAALERASQKAYTAFDREHVTSFFRSSGAFSLAAIQNDKDLSRFRWTVDEPADLETVSRVFGHFAHNIHFSWQEVLDLQRTDPSLFTPNQDFIRNEGAAIGTGQKLWKRAKRIIPGGNMLLSKRGEMFLPERWPNYFKKAKGCKVWDLDGREYTDMTIMGIGTNTLGYGHPEVDAAVKEVVASGNMSTLNCPEEVYLAERLTEIHSWADMVRFARTGGEANAIAIRIARAASGRDKVAICGYHGWHDWYLAANLRNEKGLDGHLLPGLEPCGVPQNLHGTVFPFTYNNYDELKTLIEEHDIGVIKMEVMRNVEPENEFLQKVRKIASDKGIVLIFDECTSGFRQSFGGLHKLYGVEPDMAMFGKALGNGYAMTATIGRREIMEAAQSSFISSTFWTERIGPAASLKTLEVMERIESWRVITEMGIYIRAGFQRLADSYGLKIKHWGMPALTGYTFDSPQALAYKTFITQAMLAKGYLVGNSVYVCTEHTREVVDHFLDELDPVFAKVRDFENGESVVNALHGPICHTSFSRLN